MIDLFYECEENVISHCHFWITEVFDWFGNNHTKVNPGICNLLLNNKSPEVASIDGIQMASSSAETLLGVTTDSELNLELN